MGFSSGIALSSKLNKVWRQSSFVAAGVAELMARLTNKDALDNGNLEAFVQQLELALISMRPKQVLESPLTNFYVSATRGSDFNDGMSTSAPWQTLQYAVDTVCSNFDFNMNQVVINVEDGNYTSVVVNTIPPGMASNGILGPYPLTLRGNFANPSACRIISQTNTCILADGGGQIYVEGFHFESRGTGLYEGSALRAHHGGQILFQACDFGVCSMSHITVAHNSFVGPTGSYTVSGGAPYHYRVAAGGSGGRGSTQMVISFIGDVEFSGAFMGLDGLSYVFWDAQLIQFSGAGNVTGRKHMVLSNSVLQVPNGSINTFPGVLAGSVPSQVNVPDAGGSGGLFMTAYVGDSRSAFDRANVGSFK